jgi:membrane-bound lytic murein transglycosylase D
MECLGLGFWRLQCVLLWLGAALFSLEWICLHFGKSLSYRSLLRSLYFLLPVSLIVFGIISAYARPNFDVPVQVWSGTSRTELVKAKYSQERVVSLGNFAAMQIPEALPTERLSTILLGIGVLSLLVSVIRSRRQFRKWEKESVRLRRIGGVTVALSSTLDIPLSYRWANRAVVLLPERSVTWESGMSYAVSHEIQHHRNGDTAWSWILAVLRAVSWFNPGFYLIQRSLGSFQELACDEALSARRRNSSHAYACCLWEAAQTSLESRHQPVGTTGLVTSFSGKLLKWRIEMLTHLASNKKRSYLLTGTLTFVLLVGTALATTGVVQDRRVTMEEATKWLETAKVGAEFPVVLNDRVLKSLNYYVGTPDGRKMMKNALERMKQYQPMIEQKITEFKTPKEFLAIPMVESGYQNLPPNLKKMHGAGLWMFIQETARRYDLRVVAGEVDDRIEPEKETVAAMRYLTDNYKRFKQNWDLSLLAYNVGEKAVGDGVKKYGYDAWKLVENGIENDHEYLPRVVAAMIILKNPSLVQ